ncbi:MAG: MurR/RpiR family transcriptional regulator [Erysipelotrichaceae bacterium]|nr:MurR/RpiR family transcriptional regulator [Erysipelotrichaceae bacterium]
MVNIEKLKDLSDLELDICRYILGNKDQIKNMKLKDLAQVLHVSPSMITRLSKKLGYSGYMEWRMDMKLDKTELVMPRENTLNYINDYFQKVNNKEFEDTIRKATQMIVDSHEVLFFGIGLSAMLANYGAYLLNRKGKRTIGIEDFSIRVEGIYDKNDCAVVLTVSGETRETLNRISFLKRSGIKIIVITNSASSSAARLADLALCYYVPNTVNNYFYSSATQVPVVYILECIANALNEYGVK